MTTKLKLLVIDRAKWINGTVTKSVQRLDEAGRYAEDSYVDSALQVDEGTNTVKGKMCCLGFYAKQICGLRKADILGVSMPDECSAWPSTDKLSSHKVGKPFANTNDDEKLSPKVREARLTKRFKKVLEVRVKFVGKYPKIVKG